ncbi:hypothetical protein Nmel_011947, partial [Mimus melanotis]
PAGALGAARRGRRLTGATFHKTAPAIGSLPGVSLQRSPRLARGGAAARPRAGTRPRRPQPLVLRSAFPDVAAAWDRF